MPTRLGEDWSWPPVPLDGVVELRVHGVGGTPPADMLDDPDPVQVSGDRIAGVMRGQDVVGAEGSWRLEAYSWGGLTGRAVSRALWLLVLPFAMVNLAGWMASDRQHGVHRAGVRLVGLCLTALYVLFAAEIAMDFAAYQCGGAQACATSDWPLIGSGHVADDWARRAVVGSVVPVLLVAAMARLTWVSRARYEQWGAPSVRRNAAAADEPAQHGLTHPDFWTGQAFAGRLAEIHLFVGLGLIALLLSATAGEVTTSRVAGPLTAVIAVMLLLSVGLASVTRWRARLPRRSAPIAGLALVVLSAAVAWFATPNGTVARPLPGVLDSFDVALGLLYAAALFMLVVGLTGGGRPDRAWPTRLREAFTPYALVVLAALITTTLFAGTALWVARRLGPSASVGNGPATERAAILYPQPFEALARGLVLVVALSLVAAVVAGVIAWRRIGDRTWTDLHHAWRPVPADARDAIEQRGWVRAVRRALRLPPSSLAAAEWAVWSVAALMTLGAVTYSCVWLVTWVRSGDRGGYLDTDLADVRWLPPLGFSTWLLTLTPVAAAFVLRQTLTKPSTRRLAAVAWDIATFFPRSFHPLGPPSYAERAVPELQARLRRVWSHQGSVVLLGHSQGSVLVAAAVASLPRTMPELSDRLVLLTYGCPLRRLYGRHFPAYFDDGFFADVAAALATGGWTNFYRDTDLVGHRVVPIVAGADGIVREHYLADPATRAYRPGDQLPEVRGHGHRGYRRQFDFVSCIEAEVAALSCSRARTSSDV